MSVPNLKEQNCTNLPGGRSLDVLTFLFYRTLQYPENFSLTDKDISHFQFNLLRKKIVPFTDLNKIFFQIQLKKFCSVFQTLKDSVK